MADVKIIELQVKSNISDASNNIDKLKKGLKDTTTESNALSQSMSGGKPAEFINQLGDGISKLNPAFGGAVKGANGLLVKMWEMVANPIGAILAGIVLTLKFLYESFESSVAGGKELKQVFAAVSAIGTQVKDAMFGLGRSLIDVATAAYKFITLDFKGAAEDIKKANKESTESYKQLGNAVDGTTAKLFKKLEADQQINDKARKIQTVTQAETNRLLVASRETLSDETASLKDKKKALEEVTKAEQASSREKVRIAAEDLRIAKDRAKGLGGEEEKKKAQELRELTISLKEAQTENSQTEFKLNKQKKMLGRQELADAKEIADAKIESGKQAHDADKQILDEKLKQEGLSFQQRRDLVAKDKLISKDERKKYNDEIDKEEKKYKEDKIKQDFDLEKNAVGEQLKNNKISIDEKRNIVLNDNKLSKEDRQKFLLDLQQQEIQAEDNHNKAIADLNKKYDDEKANRLADTAVKKEELDYNRRLLEIDTIAQTELEKQTLIEKLDGEHKVRMDAALDADNKKKLEKEKALADAKKAIQDATLSTIASGLDLLKKLFEGNEDVQKALIIGESALGIAKIIINTQTANSVAAASPINAIDPTYGARSAVINTISAGIGIAANIAATSKALSAMGKGGAPSGGSAGGSPMAATAPQFNVVGQGGANQIAQGLANQGAEPIKAYVVSNDVTTGQSLDRNIINNASMG